MCIVVAPFRRTASHELSHPEPDFYTVGMKSYGRAPTFLMLTGYEQVRSVVAALTGDWEAARNVAAGAAGNWCLLRWRGQRVLRASHQHADIQRFEKRSCTDRSARVTTDNGQRTTGGEMRARMVEIRAMIEGRLACGRCDLPAGHRHWQRDVCARAAAIVGRLARKQNRRMQPGGA